MKVFLLLVLLTIFSTASAGAADPAIEPPAGPAADPAAEPPAGPAAPADVNCVGQFSTCAIDCKKTYSISVPKSGAGDECTNADGDKEDCIGDACAVCEDNQHTPIATNPCSCGGASVACAVDKFCYDAVCSDAQKYPNCPESDTDTLSARCFCGDVKETCDRGQFCTADHKCDDTGTGCDRLEDTHHSYFYGAKLQGIWNEADREMQLSFPVPWDIKIESIMWEGASEPTALRYLADNHGVWSKDTADHCKPVYKMIVKQDTFFGPGSKFTLEDLRLSTNLIVNAKQTINENIGDFQYGYERAIENAVPVKVDLLNKLVVQTEFKTIFSPQTKIELGIKYASITDKAAFEQECQDTYGVACSISEFKLRRRRLEGEAGGNVVVEFLGAQTDIDAAIQKIKSDGEYKTANFGPFELSRRPTHDEFVFVKRAVDNQAAGSKTITIDLEVHSRTCINHALADTGVRVRDESLVKINTDAATGGTNTFVWAMNDAGDAVKSVIENNLCVETVTWTFAPASYEAEAYEIEVEFTLVGDLGSFITWAKIDVKEADVIQSVGFEKTVSFCADKGCVQSTVENGENKLVLGEMFYVKYQIQKLVIDIDNFVVDKFTLSQIERDTGETKTYDLKAAENADLEYATFPDGNFIIIQGYLKSEKFHASFEGYDTTLDCEMTLNYKQGAQEVALQSFRRLLGLGHPKTVSDTAHIVTPVNIITKESSLAAMLFGSNTDSHVGRMAVFFCLGAAATLVYSGLKRAKKEEYAPLMMEI